MFSDIKLVASVTVGFFSVLTFSKLLLSLGMGTYTKDAPLSYLAWQGW